MIINTRYGKVDTEAYAEKHPNYIPLQYYPNRVEEVFPTTRKQDTMTNIDEYADWAMSTWSSKGKTSQDLTFTDLFVMSTGFPGEVGEALEKLKKGVRDVHIPGQEFDLEGFKKEMGDAIYYWTMLLNYFNIMPSEVLDMNKQKSEDRKARGVEHGSGDNR